MGRRLHPRPGDTLSEGRSKDARQHSQTVLAAPPDIGNWSRLFENYATRFTDKLISRLLSEEQIFGFPSPESHRSDSPHGNTNCAYSLVLTELQPARYVGD